MKSFEDSWQRKSECKDLEVFLFSWVGAGKASGLVRVKLLSVTVITRAACRMAGNVDSWVTTLPPTLYKQFWEWSPGLSSYSVTELNTAGLYIYSRPEIRLRQSFQNSAYPISRRVMWSVLTEVRIGRGEKGREKNLESPWRDMVGLQP